jgi:hypothetical protein
VSHQRRQAVHVSLGTNDDVPAAAAVTAVRTAAGSSPFSPEADATVATVATFNMHFNTIKKHGTLWIESEPGSL